MSETESLVSKFHPIALFRFKATYGLTSGKRIKHAALMDDKAQVIVATNAFEWVDKADVKTVIHINFQKISKIIIKQVDLAEMEKSICGTSNESF
jgi:hypothetical protein